MIHVALYNYHYKCNSVALIAQDNVAWFYLKTAIIINLALSMDANYLLGIINKHTFPPQNVVTLVAVHPRQKYILMCGVGARGGAHGFPSIEKTLYLL